LNVFAKLGEDGLEWRLEGKAFSWGQIGGYDGVLDFGVGEPIDIEMSRQPAPQSSIGVFDSARRLNVCFGVAATIG
jgi:hypothetical protein